MLTTLLLIGNKTDEDVFPKVKGKAIPVHGLRVPGG
jgi:hypothetical protein